MTAQSLFQKLAFSAAVPEFIDPVFTKTSPKRSFSLIQTERFGLVFAKTGSIISGTGNIEFSKFRAQLYFRDVEPNTRNEDRGIGGPRGTKITSM